MFDSNDQLEPSTVDPRVRSAVLAAGRTAGKIDTADLVLGGLRSGDPAIAAVFLAANLTGRTDLSELSWGFDGAAPEPEPRTRDGFTPAALRALNEFEALARQHPDVVSRVGLELLLHRALLHLDAAGRERLRALNPDAAATLLRHRVASALGPPPDPPGTSAPPLEIEGTEDLTARAQAAPDPSPFDGVPDYEALFDALAQGLHRRRARHVFLTGERGVGKSTVVAELARRATLGRPPFLRDLRVAYADFRYVPPDEVRPRFAALLGRAADRPGAVLCVDGFGPALRADRAGVRSVLLTALAAARFRFVGLLTPREYEDLVADDPEYAEFFTRVEVPEPDPETALGLLRHFARGLEHEFGVAIEDAAVARAVRLTADYVLSDHLPGKALAVLHRVCEDADYDQSQRGRARDRVTAGDVVRAVAAASGIPEETLDGVAARADYESSLGEVVFGQPHVVRAVATELGLIKAGMTDPTKPASVLLFLGQTGTGKTETAKALARFYSSSKRLKTYALGNCVEPHSVATIIGVPPGYVGHDQGGRLVTELNADPYGVFLLDEADKAHPDVLQPFLNLFDEGWLADQRGVRAHAGKSIFVLTSNVGQRMIADWFAQGLGHEEVAAKVKETLPQIRHGKLDRPVFAPEFLARVKRVLVFRPLGADAVLAIAHKHVRDLARTWAEQRGKHLVVPDDLVGAVAARAHALNERSKGKEGGRVVRRLVADWIETPLQRELTRSPESYRAAAAVELECLVPAPIDDQAVPEVRVVFRPLGTGGPGVT